MSRPDACTRAKEHRAEVVRRALGAARPPTPRPAWRAGGRGRARARRAGPASQWAGRPRERMPAAPWLRAPAGTPPAASPRGGRGLRNARPAASNSGGRSRGSSRPCLPGTRCRGPQCHAPRGPCEACAARSACLAPCHRAGDALSCRPPRRRPRAKGHAPFLCVSHRATRDRHPGLTARGPFGVHRADRPGPKRCEEAAAFAL